MFTLEATSQYRCQCCDSIQLRSLGSISLRKGERGRATSVFNLSGRASCGQR